MSDFGPSFKIAGAIGLVLLVLALAGAYLLGRLL